MYPKPPYPKVSVVICALNEEKNLPYVLPKVPSWVDEVLLLDGYSTDETVKVARRLRHDIKVFYQPRRGKGDALKYGINRASGDIVVTLDADGATDPAEMHKFVEPLVCGYDFAKGSRLVYGLPEGMSRHRWFGNKVLALTSSILFGVGYTDICSGYNAFWRDKILGVRLRNEGFEMEQELNVKMAKLGFKVVEVPHRHERRISGVSKTRDAKQGIKDFLTVILERFRL